MPTTIPLPRQFNRQTMYGFLSSAIGLDGTPQDTVINFDFSQLAFITPDGATAFCNLLEYLAAREVTGNFQGYGALGPAIRYLDDCGIFSRYTGNALRQGCVGRATTITYPDLAPVDAHARLDLVVSPIVAGWLGVPEAALADFRWALREVFTNIGDHSGQNIGGMHIQYFPNRNKIAASISDFGIGIPTSMRSSFHFEKDCEAIFHSLGEAVSTRAGPRHSGFGLYYLIRNVVSGNRGQVNIYSNRGQLVCLPGPNGPRYAKRDVQGWYPGTLVAIELNADRFVEVEEDLEW